MLSLDSAKVNSLVVIVSFKDDRKYIKHLKDMGFVVGETIKIISNNKGDLICEIRTTKFAISYELSSKVFIKEIE